MAKKLKVSEESTTYNFQACVKKKSALKGALQKSSQNQKDLFLLENEKCYNG